MLLLVTCNMPMYTMCNLVCTCMFFQKIKLQKQQHFTNRPTNQPTNCLLTKVVPPPPPQFHQLRYNIYTMKYLIKMTKNLTDTTCSQFSHIIRHVDVLRHCYYVYSFKLYPSTYYLYHLQQLLKFENCLPQNQNHNL